MAISAIIEEQLGGFFSAMKLCDDWKTEIVRRLDTVDPEQSEKQRLRLELQMNQAKKLFMWDDITEDEYRFELTQLRARLTEMKPPQYHQVFAAGDLLQNFGILWQNATRSERKRLLTATVDEPFVTDQRVTALRPKVAFYLAIQPGLQAIAKHVLYQSELYYTNQSFASKTPNKILGAH